MAYPAPGRAPCAAGALDPVELVVNVRQLGRIDADPGVADLDSYGLPGAGARQRHDAHDLDVTRILLFDTKSMLALPGRTYDLHGPGWQQENWRMGAGGRGYGSHRSWLPWVTVNHLHSITGLQLYDPALYQQLVKEDEE